MGITIKRTGFDQFLDSQGGAWIKCLIMGDHGVGKTPSAAQWPKPIIADCENGLMSVASNAVPYAEIGSTKDMEELIAHLRLDSRKAPANRAYQTLVIDTIDTYQRKMIFERLAAEQKDSISGWADWGWLDAKMSQLMEAIVSLKMNVVVNMHTKDVSTGDDDDRQLVTKARLKGDIKDSIFQEFDLIGQMETAYVLGTEGKQKGQRVETRQIRWHSEPRFPALRDRSNRLPRFTPVTFTPADYQIIFDTITAGIDTLPASEVVEEVAGGAATAEPVEGAEGGPVTPTDLPAPKAAKKTAAKKTAAPAKAATPVAQDQASTSTAAVAAEQKAENQGEVKALQELGATAEQANEAVASTEAEQKAEPEVEETFFDMPARIKLCPLVRVGKPHKFGPVQVGTRGGKAIFNQICAECHVREADLDHDEKKEQAELMTAGGPDPWAPPAEPEAATPEVQQSDADADAAEQLLAESLGAEEVDPVMDLSGEQTNGKGTADQPVFLPGDLDMAKESRIVETLEHVHLPDGTCRKNAFGPLCGDEAPEEAAAAPAAAAPAAKPGAPTCGDQPESMVGKKEPVAGCGTPLNSSTNAKRAQIAMIRLGTFLCDSCHDAAKAA